MRATIMCLGSIRSLDQPTYALALGRSSNLRDEHRNVFASEYE